MADKCNTGGKVTAPPVSTRSEPESSVDMSGNNKGTTSGQPDKL